LIYHKFVLILKFKYILFTMQPRLQPRSGRGTPLIRTLIKILLVIFVVIFGFYFVEKINFPSPQEEIIEDVTDKINKLK